MTREQLHERLEKDIRGEFGDSIVETFNNYGMLVVVVDPAKYHDLAAWCKASGEWQFNHFIDITAVDYFTKSPDYRYELVVHLRSQHHNLKFRIKTRLAGDNPTVATLTDIYVGASWSEREVFDLMGIVFLDHPRMTRILNPDDFVGHPLRKDFPVKGLHRGTFPKGTVISNKRTENVVIPRTKPKPADQILPRTPWEKRRHPFRPGEEKLNGNGAGPNGESGK